MLTTLLFVFMMSKPCIATLDISRNDNPWSGYTGSYQEEQAGKGITATAIDASFERLPHLATYAGPDGPFLAIDRAKSRIVVNSKYFTDLHRADATRLSSGRTVIGSYKDLRFSAAPPRKLVLFLLESQIIQTYWHLESQLCLASEQDTPGAYRALFTGKHIYYTNKRNEAPLSFVVVIDKKTGSMTIDSAS